MGKFSRYDYSVASQRGTAITKTSAYTITEADILRIGQFFVCSGVTTLTLPAASGNLKGVSIYVHGNNASSKVTVAAGFGGGGASYSFVTIGAYNTLEFWCNGTNWYVLSSTVGSS